MKNLPPELAKWYFPFNWDVEALWNLPGEIQQREVEKMEWHLDKPFWSSAQGNGMLFDLRPIDVLENPQSIHIIGTVLSRPIQPTLYA